MLICGSPARAVHARCPSSSACTQTRPLCRCSRFFLHGVPFTAEMAHIVLDTRSTVCAGVPSCMETVTSTAVPCTGFLVWGSCHGQFVQFFAQQQKFPCVQVFTEAEVRASLVFHLSNLVTLLLAGARQAAQGTAWDPMVAGEASSA